MNYWIASSNRTNWKIIRKNNVWGIPKRNRNIQTKVEIGDIIIIYIRSDQLKDSILPSAITGSFSVEKCYEDHNRIFIPPSHMGDEIFPYRFKLKPIKIFKEPLEFKPLISDLQFITNKTVWSGHLRVAMREIPEKDYDYIMKKGNAL